MRRHYPDGRALAVAGRTPKQITTAIGQVVLPKPIFPLEEKLEVVSHRAARSRIEHHGVPVVSRLQPSLAVVVSKYRSVLSCTCCTSKRTFAACAMNQCGADEGVDMGMSPGGNTSGTFTLITGRDRPRILKATGQSCMLLGTLQCDPVRSDSRTRCHFESDLHQPRQFEDRSLRRHPRLGRFGTKQLLRNSVRRNVFYSEVQLHRLSGAGCCAVC
jgi:hypothetical protein